MAALETVPDVVRAASLLNLPRATASRALHSQFQTRNPDCVAGDLATDLDLQIAPAHSRYATILGSPPWIERTDSVHNIRGFYAARQKLKLTNGRPCAVLRKLQIMNSTLVRALAALVPTAMLLTGAGALFARTRTASCLFQLIWCSGCVRMRC